MRSQPDRLVFNAEPWMKYMDIWANCMVNIAQANAPFPIYFEEHAQDNQTPEWRIFHDEWDSPIFSASEGRGRQASWRNGKYSSKLFGGPDSMPNITFTPSYIDFCLYYANEWMKRGVGLYFDNTYLKSQYDPLVSDAYVTEGGRIQPGVSIWAQRDYYRRIWNLMNELSEKGTPYPLTFTQHMTNQNVLPFLTWNTANLDNEGYAVDYDSPVGGGGRRSRAAFHWQYLLTEMTGRQTGSIPHSLYPLSGPDKPAFFDGGNGPGRQGRVEVVRAEWGIRIVHEIYRWLYPYESYVSGSYASGEPAASFEKLWWNFGYGKPECQVYNYWDDSPWLQVNNDEVKWIVLSRPAQKPLGLIVLQSFQREEATIRIKPAKGAILCDAETGERIARNADGSFTIIMPGSNGMRLYYVADTESEVAAVKPLGTRQ
jgi:hypothetical protein